MDHKKESIIEALNLDLDDYNKTADILGSLDEISVNDVIEKIKSTKIKKAEYYVSIFTILVSTNALENVFNKFLLTTTTTEAANNIDIPNAIATLAGFLATTDRQTIESKLAIIMIPIILLGATGEIPNSICVELLVKIIKLHKCSLAELIDASVILGLFLDPLTTHEKLIQ